MADSTHLPRGIEHRRRLEYDHVVHGVRVVVLERMQNELENVQILQREVRVVSWISHLDLISLNRA